jgi:ATP-dependent DNA ligase
VGTGVSDHERAVLHERLMAISVKREKGRSPPSCYRVTGLPKETPDYWVKDPFSSIVLQARMAAGYVLPQLCELT